MGIQIGDFATFCRSSKLEKSRYSTGDRKEGVAVPGNSLVADWVSETAGVARDGNWVADRQADISIMIASIESKFERLRLPIGFNFITTDNKCVAHSYASKRLRAASFFYVGAAVKSFGGKKNPSAGDRFRTSISRHPDLYFL